MINNCHWSTELIRNAGSLRHVLGEDQIGGDTIVADGGLLGSVSNHSVGPSLWGAVADDCEVGRARLLPSRCTVETHGSAGASPSRNPLASGIRRNPRLHATLRGHRLCIAFGHQRDTMLPLGRLGRWPEFSKSIIEYRSQQLLTPATSTDGTHARTESRAAFAAAD